MSPSSEPPHIRDRGHDPRPANVASDRAAGRVEPVMGQHASVQSDTDGLRQIRLRAAALFFLVAVAVGMLRAQLVGTDSLWALQAAVMTAMAIAVVLLSERRALPARVVRGSEVVIFGVMVFYLAVRQYHTTVTAVGRGDVGGVAAATSNSVLRSVLLMVAYGMLIPNTWRQAVRIVAAIGIVPVLMEILLLLAHPEFRRLVTPGATLDRVSGNLFLLILGAALAVYGPYVFHSLRKQVAEARHLNQYRLVERLGEGGMGAVYLAEHSLLKRPCALKLIRPDRAGEALLLARFEREVQSTACLSHPNIIEIFDYGRTAEGTFYYVMEYLRGLSLEQLLNRHGPLPPGRVIHFLRQACQALGEAHGAGLVHRDIKPANLFAVRHGRRFDLLKVLDFGLVAPASPSASAGLTLEGRIPGSPLFMAPEQVRGVKTLDGRSDLYGLGGVAYALLTGHPAFEGVSANEVMIAQVHDPVTPPSRLRPDVPKDLERIVLRCLAKEPADRYPDAEALEADLASCADSGSWNAAQAERWWAEFEPDATPEANRCASAASTGGSPEAR